MYAALQFGSAIATAQKMMAKSKDTPFTICIVMSHASILGKYYILYDIWDFSFLESEFIYLILLIREKIPQKSCGI